MKKIEPALSQYRRNKDGDVSRWITAPDAGLIAEMGYDVRHLYTREAIEAVAEAVRDATWNASGEGWNGEYPYHAKPDVCITQIINNILGE